MNTFPCKKSINCFSTSKNNVLGYANLLVFHSDYNFCHKVHTSSSIENFSIEHTSVGLTHALPISYILSPVSCKKAVLRTFTCWAEEAWFTAATCRAGCTVQQRLARGSCPGRGGGSLQVDRWCVAVELEHSDN